MEQHFRILGLSINTSIEELKRAYRLKAKQFHPDVNSDKLTAEKNFKEIQNAYDAIQAALRSGKLTLPPVAPPPPKPKPKVVPPLVRNKEGIITLYRIPQHLHSGLQHANILTIPEEAARCGALVFVMIGYKEVKISIPPKAQSGMTATVNSGGNVYLFELKVVDEDEVIFGPNILHEETVSNTDYRDFFKRNFV